MRLRLKPWEEIQDRKRDCVGTVKKDKMYTVKEEEGGEGMKKTMKNEKNQQGTRMEEEVEMKEGEWNRKEK